jgi:hypothetical protein
VVCSRELITRSRGSPSSLKRGFFLSAIFSGREEWYGPFSIPSFYLLALTLGGFLQGGWGEPVELLIVPEWRRDHTIRQHRAIRLKVLAWEVRGAEQALTPSLTCDGILSVRDIPANPNPRYTACADLVRRAAGVHRMVIFASIMYGEKGRENYR